MFDFRVTLDLVVLTAQQDLQDQEYVVPHLMNGSDFTVSFREHQVLEARRDPMDQLVQLVALVSEEISELMANEDKLYVCARTGVV